MKMVVCACVFILLWLLYNLWFGPSGYFTQQQLSEQLEVRKARVEVLKHRNQILTAEVLTLQDEGSKQAVIESRARFDLGLVKPGEVYYLIPES